MAPGRTDSCALRLLCGSLLLATAAEGATFMVTRYADSPDNGEATCASVGLNFGPWTSERTMTAALSYLTSKGVSDELYIGMIKKYQFNVIEDECRKLTSVADIAAALQWLKNGGTSSVPVYFFNSRNTTIMFDNCELSEKYIYVKRSNGAFQYRDGSRDRKCLCVKELDLPQPFVWMNRDSTAALAQSDVCGPGSMTFARFYSMDDVFAFKRLVHENSDNLLSLPLKKKERFSTISLDCTTASSVTEIANLLQWTIGDSRVSPELFKNVSFDLNRCNAMCLFIRLYQRNRIWMKDGGCLVTTPIVCGHPGETRSEAPIRTAALDQLVTRSLHRRLLQFSFKIWIVRTAQVSSAPDWVTPPMKKRWRRAEASPAPNMAPGRTVSCALHLLCGSLLLATAAGKITVTMTKIYSTPDKGQENCAALGLNYGRWSPQVASAAASYLQDKGLNTELSVGLKKKEAFKTIPTSACASKTKPTDIANALQWTTAVNTAVPSSLFNSSNTDFKSCFLTNIHVKLQSGMVQYLDDAPRASETIKKFLCLKENAAGETVFNLTTKFYSADQGTEACATFGSSFVPFGSPDKMSAALSFLRSKTTFFTVWIGLKKRSKFTTSSCNRRTTATDVAAALQWISAPSEAVTPSLFNSSNLNLYYCHQTDIFVKMENATLKYFDSNQHWYYNNRRFLCTSENDLPQPFVRIDAQKSFHLIQREVCGPQSMTFGRFYSMDEVMAYKRILNEHSANIFWLSWLPLQKSEPFTMSTTSVCKTVSSIEEFFNLTRWTIGDPYVSTELFKDLLYVASNCDFMCFYILLTTNNRFYIRDMNCSYSHSSFSVICRNSSGECPSEAPRRQSGEAICVWKEV